MTIKKGDTILVTSGELVGETATVIDPRPLPGREYYVRADFGRPLFGTTTTELLLYPLEWCKLETGKDS